MAEMAAKKTAEQLLRIITELTQEKEALHNQLDALQDPLEEAKSAQTIGGRGETISKKGHKRLMKAQKDWIEKEAGEQEDLLHKHYRSEIARWELTVADTSN